MHMKCQVEGCQNAATVLRHFATIRKGIYVSGSAKICTNHKAADINKTIEQVADKKVDNILLCDPFSVSNLRTG